MLNGNWPDGKQPADWNAQLRGGDANGSVGTAANAGSRAQTPAGDEGGAMIREEAFSPGVFGETDADADVVDGDAFGGSLDIDMGGVFGEELGFQV